jgi:hypothetical protein
MAEPRFDFDLKTGKGTGRWIIEDGTPVDFLPELPGNSPPYELIHNLNVPHPNPNHDDGHRHYLIGGDPAVVEQIVAWYKAAGHPVPDGYAQAAADHVAAVKTEADRVAGIAAPPAAP